MLRHRVLLVDDEPWFIEALVASLEAAGLECVACTDMSSALRELEKGGISAVVTDIMMPPGADYPRVDSSETGFYFVREIRERFLRMPIVCLSVIGDQKCINELKRQGVVYLRKGETPLARAVQVIKYSATGLSTF